MTGEDGSEVRLLAQADLLFLLAGRLRSGHGNDDPAEGAAMSDLRRLEEASGLDNGGASLDDMERARRAVPEEQLRTEHCRLFEGAVLCPPNETAYVRRDKGTILADLAGFHRAFGFEHDEQVGEKRDHIISEIQFVGLLLVMFARARSSDLREEEKVTYDALAAFAGDHLGTWIESFCDRLIECTELIFFTHLAGVLRKAWSWICADNGLPLPETAAAELDRQSGSPYECGGCPSAR
jgi:TorA maturation chaperone TorD